MLEIKQNIILKPLNKTLHKLTLQNLGCNNERTKNEFSVN